MNIDTIVLAHAGEVHAPNLLTSAGIVMLLVLGLFLFTRSRDAFDTPLDGGKGEERDALFDTDVVLPAGTGIRGVIDPADPLRSP